MPYTLTAGLLWYAAALGIGIVLGWLLRSTSALRQVSRARRQERSAVQGELDDLRTRAASEEELRLERNRLRHDNDLLREQLASSGLGVDSVAGPAIEVGAPTAEVTAEDSLTPADLEEGGRLIGRRLSTDDLQVINGIGPVIEGLLNGIGISTWSDLAAADVDALSSMLADAGSRFARHDPSTWPLQARLLAEGRWSDFQRVGDSS
jgi:predicted flap endonuclease-1-like 5' DNA nuclease